MKESIFISLITIGGLGYLLLYPKINKQIIKQFEGLRLKVYKDTGGKLTIGYGHLIKIPQENYLLNPKGITKQKAEQLLNEDIKTAKNTVEKYVKVKINNNQLNALVSLIFNIGENAFKNSTLLKYINQNKIQLAASEFPKWRYINGKESAGLLARRAKEQTMFMS